VSTAAPTIEGRSRLVGSPHRTVAVLRHIALRGAAFIYLGALVVLPVAAIITKGFGDGFATFSHAMAVPGAWAAIRLTLVTATIVAAINAVMGTTLAWVIVRYRFPGRSVLSTIVDLPLAIPTLVWGS
jgi:sulfate transport system permease protein